MSECTMLCRFSVVVCCLLCAAPVFAQTDSSTQASPTAPPPKAATVDDTAAEASPILPHMRLSFAVPVHTAIAVQLMQPADSGVLKDGQTLKGALTAPVKLASGRTLPKGTSAQVTVIATVPAGKINAVGEMSLQLISVGSVAVFTDTLTFRGKAGHKDLPDSAPETGTDAGLAKGVTLTFHVQPDPKMASGPPKGTRQGAVNGVSSGEKPPAATPPQ